MKRSFVFINTISIIVPLVVAILLAMPNKIDLGNWTRNLSHAIGITNSITSLVLVFGLIFAKRKNVRFHRIAMTTAFFLGIAFLIFYIMYHLTNPATKFGGEGIIRYVYFVILLSHIGLSLVVLPLVLRAMYFAVTAQFDLHKRIVKYAYPIWLYVSISGVISYLMLYQLFPTK